MYQALARKYRPQTWAEVIGQGHVTVTLANAIRQGRLHHAYLFAGARGVGKTTVARILAKAINCVAPTATGEPCNRCPSCGEITEGRSLDVQEIDGASNTSVDDVREIRERVKYLPTRERSKIYIIDEVHMLSKAAFNALLKTLEEPPPHVIFLFATTEPHKIPVTILSRCQRYDFRRVGVPQLVALLRQVATQEGVTVGDDLLQLLAFEAEGAVRDAESLLDQAIAFCGQTITQEQVRQLLGLTDRAAIWALVEAICQRDATASLGGLESVFQTGGHLPRLAQEVLELFRHLWVTASCGVVPAGVALPSGEVARIEALARQATLPEWQQWFALLFRGMDGIVRGPFPKLAFESLLLQMVQVGPMEPIDGLLQRVEAMMQREMGTIHPETPAVLRPAVAPTSTVSTPAASPAGEGSWEEFLTHAETVRPQLASILRHGTMRRTAPALIELHFPKGSFHAEMLREPERKAQLQTLLETWIGSACRYRIVEDEGPSTADRRVAERKAEQETAGACYAQGLEHAAVKEAQAVLGAEVEEVRTLYGKSP